MIAGMAKQEVTSRYISTCLRFVLLSAAIAIRSAANPTAEAQGTLHITHQYADVDARSMIGLPMGSHKTIVTRDGQLLWSQWSLANKGQFSSGSASSLTARSASTCVRSTAPPAPRWWPALKL